MIMIVGDAIMITIAMLLLKLKTTKYEDASDIIL